MGTGHFLTMENPAVNREVPRPASSYSPKQLSGTMLANIELTTPASTTELKNPMKADPELMTLTKKVEHIKKYKSFNKWKTKFLDRLDTLLYEKGMKPADQSCTEFDNLLEKQLKFANKVSTHIEKGELSDERKTVKAALALSEMCKVLTTVVEETQTLVPGTKKEEKMKGFTKFHLGAALVRQGFHQYGSMCAIETFCKEIREPLHYVADRQQHELFEYYALVFERWIDVIKDMGLYEIMLACQKFRHPPEEEESSSVDPVIVHLTVKTEDGSKVIPLEIDSSETIGNIKDCIAGACGIPPEKQVLSWNNDELKENNKTLDDLGIEDAATFVVSPYRIPVKIRTMDGEIVDLNVEPDEYLSELKRMLEDRVGIPAKNQKLSLKGKELDEPMKRLDDYGVNPGAVIDLEPSSINVKLFTPDGKAHSMSLCPSDGLEDIKKKVSMLTKMPVEKQVLSLEGKEIPDSATVRKLGLREGDELAVDLYKIPIKIKTSTGEVVETTIDPTEYISDLKVQIEPFVDIPAKNQRLSKAGCELSDPMKTLVDCGIEAGDTLNLEPTVLNVHAKTPDGKSHSIQISLLEDCSNIKKKIERVSGIPTSKQVLSYKGKEMPSRTNARDIGIQEGDDILVDIYRVPVTVNVLNGESFELLVDPSDPVGSLKEHLETRTGIEVSNQRLSKAGEDLKDDQKTAGDYGIEGGTILDLEPKRMDITVSTPDGCDITIQVSPRLKTEDVKGIIEDRTGIKVPSQILKFEGSTLADGRTLGDIGVRHDDNLKVEVVQIPVTVRTLSGQNIHTTVDPTKTILELKKKLESESGIPADNQRLFKDGDELVNGKLAGEYDVKPGSFLDLEPKKMNIKVDVPDFERFSLAIEPSFSGEKIKSLIHEKTGLKIAQQILKKDGKTIENGSSAKTAGVLDNDTLTVELFKINITVGTMDGEKIKTAIDPFKSIGDIKKALASESGVPADNQVLFKDGKVLANDKTASECGILDGDELDLEPRFMRVTATTPDGNIHNLDIRPDDTLDDIKRKIEDASSLSAHRQVPKLNGKDLKNGLRARNMGIRDGTSLLVGLYKIPIAVVFNDSEFGLEIEPVQSIDSIKKMCHGPSGVEPRKQVLTFDNEDLSNGKKSAQDYGIARDAKLYLEVLRDDIIFVDVKCGTLFGMDRQDVIDKEALTPLGGNRLDFLETSKDATTREKLQKAMVESPKLGVNRQVVVEGIEVEDYDLAEAQAVSSLWGVSLKKVQKNKKGEEFLFIDPKTGACGELSRKKYLDRNFITIVEDGKEGSTLAQKETNVQAYDKMVKDIRRVFNI